MLARRRHKARFFSPSIGATLARKFPTNQTPGNANREFALAHNMWQATDMSDQPSNFQITPSTGAASEAKITAREAQSASRAVRADAAAAQAGYAAAPVQTSQPAQASPQAEEMEQIRSMLRQDRNRARIEAIRQMGGLTHHFTEQQVLALVPDADPREPAGQAAFDAWAKSNAALMRRNTEDPAVLAARAAAREGFDKWSRGTKLFNPDALVDSMYGVSKPVDPAAEKAARRAQLEAVAARGGALFGGAKKLIDWTEE